MRTVDDIHIKRFESGVEESAFSIEDNELECDRVEAFHPSGNADPLWKVTITFEEARSKKFEVETPKSDVVHHVRQFLDDMVADGEIDENPLRE